MNPYPYTPAPAPKRRIGRTLAFAATTFVALVIGAGIGAVGVEPEVVTETRTVTETETVVEEVEVPVEVVTEVEVERTPQACLDALTTAEEAFAVASDGFGYAADGFAAYETFDVLALEDAIDGMTSTSEQAEALSGTYNSQAAECRSAE